ncbi:hypothetical protein Tco_1069753 [Tanacetum coccineum]|uniref:Uncharacterized protein n=1 Tax=Tanacetum coccineum TaxID=301880 RepID=A0ABQ5HJG7_9ASTR
MALSTASGDWYLHKGGNVTAERWLKLLLNEEILQVSAVRGRSGGAIINLRCKIVMGLPRQAWALKKENQGKKKPKALNIQGNNKDQGSNTKESRTKGKTQEEPQRDCTDHVFTCSNTWGLDWIQMSNVLLE